MAAHSYFEFELQLELVAEIFRSQSRVNQIDFTFPTRFGCPPTQLAFHQIELVEIDVEVELEVVFNFQSHQIVFPSLHYCIPASPKIHYFSNR